MTCAVLNLTRHRRSAEDDVYYPRSGFDVLRLLLRLRYDVIHLHVGGDLSQRLVLLGLVCTVLPWAKVVLTFHSGGYPQSPAGQRAGPRTLRGFVLRRFDRHIAVNQELVGFFQRVGCARERVRLIPPHAMPVASVAGLTRVDLPPAIMRFASTHQPLITTVSGLEPEYDIPLQLEALGAIRERHPDAGLVIAGSGSLMEELRTLANAKPYRDHILLAGDLPHTVTLSTVAQSDLFLRTTHYDGDAISVREALWLGTPVIATDNGMRPASVHLVPVGDLAALTDAMETQLATPRGNARNGPSDLKPIGEENLDATLRLYEEVLGHAPSRHQQMPR